MAGSGGAGHIEATSRNEKVETTATGRRPRAARPIACRGIGAEEGEAWRMHVRVKRTTTELNARVNRG